MPLPYLAPPGGHASDLSAALRSIHANVQVHQAAPRSKTLTNTTLFGVKYCEGSPVKKLPLQPLEKLRQQLGASNKPFALS